MIETLSATGIPEEAAEGLDAELRATLGTVRSAVETLRAYDVTRLLAPDAEQVRTWKHELRTAQAQLRGVFDARGEVAPPSVPGHSARMTAQNMAHHVRKLSELVEAELESVGEVRLCSQLGSYRLLGLYFRLREIVYFVLWLEEQLGVPASAMEQSGSFEHVQLPEAVEVSEQSPSAAPAAPVVPARVARPIPPEAPAPQRAPPLDIRDHADRPAEASGVEHSGPLTAWHAYGRGPEFAGHEHSLDATAVLPINDGVVFALADGAENSLGARVASSVVSTTFCKLLAGFYSPMRNVEDTLSHTASWTLQHLDQLLRALVAQADDAPALAQISGSLPQANARRILQNTLLPDTKLRHVAPALAVSLMGGLLRRNPELNTYEMFLLRVGGGSIERKRRGVRSEPILSHTPELLTNTFHAGFGGRELMESVKVLGPIPVSPGEAILISSASMSRGHEDSIWDLLSRVDPHIDRHWDGADDRALTLLRHAAQTADKVDALEGQRVLTRLADESLSATMRARLVQHLTEERSRKQLFAGDMSMIIISLDGRTEVGKAPPKGVERRADPQPKRVAPPDMLEKGPRASVRKSLDVAGIWEILNRKL